MPFEYTYFYGIVMSKTLSIRFKAAFLLLVFALNTLVGFACSVGMNMGFNSKHHHEEATTEKVHVHADGKSHIHKKNHSHSHHTEIDNDHKSTGDKDDCCKDKVVKITQLDKALVRPFTIAQPVFVTAFLPASYKISLLHSTDIVTDLRQFVRSYHPPIPDIRIAIQSFQI